MELLCFSSFAAFSEPANGGQVALPDAAGRLPACRVIREARRRPHVLIDSAMPESTLPGCCFMISMIEGSTFDMVDAGFLYARTTDSLIHFPAADSRKPGSQRPERLSAEQAGGIYSAAPIFRTSWPNEP